MTQLFMRKNTFKVHGFFYLSSIFMLGCFLPISVEVLGKLVFDQLFLISDKSSPLLEKKNSKPSAELAFCYRIE